MVVDALNAVDHRNGCWYFCTGNGKPATAVAHWHRSRDSFAVSLLEQGVSIETVSMLLGHSGIRITLRDCRPWATVVVELPGIAPFDVNIAKPSIACRPASR